MSGRQQVAVVTGGGGGIGAAVAEELGRSGWLVVTVDPLVTLDGTQQLAESQQTTADRIVAAGGSARASSVSVTDAEAVGALFHELVDDHGGVDAVINVAGITRQTYFASGTEADWLAVLEVHLQGYLNMLGAALPVMAEAGHGRVVGVTSGSGWRAADAGAYSCAKRAVAALTWQLGPQLPSGVTVNAMSPIAATRMVAAAVERARQAGTTGAGGGLSLFAAMPGPEHLGPLGAHLVDDAFGWCSGQVLFAGGSEIAVIDQPRLLEVVRSDTPGSLGAVLDAVVPSAFAPAEAAQATGGGGNPRFGPIFDEPAAEPAPAPVQSCAVVSDRRHLAAAVTAALEARSVTCHHVEVAHGFDDAAKALRAAADTTGAIDAVVVALSGRQPATGSPPGWERVLAEHADIVDDIHRDATWARAAADYSSGAGRPLRVVTLVDATTAGGRSRAQAAAQLARAAAGATGGRVAAFAVSVEAPETDAARPSAELVAHLLGHPDATALAASELAIGRGWIGLRSHPRALGSLIFGGPAVPDWLDDALREMVGASGARRREQT